MQETQEMRIQSLVWEDGLEEGMATHSSILARRIPGTQEPGGLWFIRLQRARHDWSDLAHVNTVKPPRPLAAYINLRISHKRRKEDWGGKRQKVEIIVFLENLQSTLLTEKKKKSDKQKEALCIKKIKRFSISFLLYVPPLTVHLIYQLS